MAKAIDFFTLLLNMIDFFLHLYDAEQNKPDRIYRKVRKHMNKPRGVDVIVRFVKIVEDAAADNKPEK